MFRIVYNSNKYELESLVRSKVGDKLDPFLEYLSKTDFYYTPASRAYHDNYPGGLYDHSKRLFEELCTLRDKMNKNWTDLELLIISFGHDLCKIGLYYPSVNNGVITYSYNPNYGKGKGHGTESLSILANIIPDLINKRIANSIVCHMGLWTEDIPNHSEYLLNAQSEDDLVFFTHSADMVSSKSGKLARSVEIGSDGFVKINY